MIFVCCLELTFTREERFQSIKLQARKIRRVEIIYKKCICLLYKALRTLAKRPREVHVYTNMHDKEFLFTMVCSLF